MTRTEKSPAAMGEADRANSKVSQQHCRLRKVKIQQYIYELQNQGWIEPAMIILLLIGGQI